MYKISGLVFLGNFSLSLLGVSCLRILGFADILRTRLPRDAMMLTI